MMNLEDVACKKFISELPRQQNKNYKVRQLPIALPESTQFAALRLPHWLLPVHEASP